MIPENWDRIVVILRKGRIESVENIPFRHVVEVRDYDRAHLLVEGDEEFGRDEEGVTYYREEHC